LFTSSESKPPISQIRLELDAPCIDPKGVSSLNETIYQPYEYNQGANYKPVNCKEGCRLPTHSEGCDQYDTGFKMVSDGSIGLSLYQIYESNGVIDLQNQNE